MKYFAYGSNCNPAVMQKKRIEYSSAKPAALAGYRMLFNKMAMREQLPPGIGYANINEDPDSTVEGILYEIDDDHLGRLDESERYPDHYTRIKVTVETEEGNVLGTSYQAQSDKIAAGLKPSRDYLNHLLAAKSFLSWQYFQALDKSQTFETECACCRKSREIVVTKEGDQFHMLCQRCHEARLVSGKA